MFKIYTKLSSVQVLLGRTKMVLPSPPPASAVEMPVPPQPPRRPDRGSTSHQFSYTTGVAAKGGAELFAHQPQAVRFLHSQVRVLDRVRVRQTGVRERQRKMLN